MTRILGGAGEKEGHTRHGRQPVERHGGETLLDMGSEEQAGSQSGWGARRRGMSNGPGEEGWEGLSKLKRSFFFTLEEKSTFWLTDISTLPLN